MYKQNILTKRAASAAFYQLVDC